MSTASAFPPDRPLRAVPNTDHIQRQKNLMGAFLATQDVLTRYASKGGAFIADLLDKLHVGAALTQVRRACGWLFSGLTLLRRGLGASGVRPALAWLLSTHLGQAVFVRTTGAVAQALTTAARVAVTSTTWLLRLFGAPGARAAGWVEARATNVRVAVQTRYLPMVQLISSLLTPRGMAMQTVRTWAKGRVLTEALGRLLPRPWNLIGKILANVLVLPAGVRREAVKMATGLRPDAVTPRAAAAAGTPASNGPVTPPEDTPPAAPSVVPVRPLFTEAHAHVVDLAAHRAPAEAPVQEPLRDLPEASGSFQRYPANRRSPNAKRKR